MIRLDNYLSTVTDLSRSQSKRAIKAGQVRVQGETVVDPRASLSKTALVELDGKVLRTATPRYFMMNKPLDCVSATKDKQHHTAIDLMDEDNSEQLHIAGRLDIDSTGLLLITDDGQWSHRITSPKTDCKKTYYVETYEAIDPSVILLFEQGVQLKNERRSTLPAQLVLNETHIAQITLSEGKYHQVKRMFAAVGNKVEHLHRLRIGGICLDEALKPGEYRALNATEIACV